MSPRGTTRPAPRILRSGSPRQATALGGSLVALIIGLSAPAGCLPPEDDDELEELDFEPAGPDTAPDPSTLGPFPVGVRTMSLTYNSGSASTGERTLAVEIWYPAAASARGEDGEVYDLYTYVPDDMKDDIPPDALGELETIAVRDAEVQPDRGPFPLVVFSHGKGGIRMQSTFFTTTLASHGYVVIAPDHTGDTILDQLAAGDIDVTSTVESLNDRPLDVSFMIEHFTNLEDDDPLYGHVDAEHVGVSGHSFGALTTFRTTAVDGRIDAIVAHTPTSYSLVNIGSPMAVEDMEIPMMIQGAGQDRTLPVEEHADRLWDHMPAPRFYLLLETAGHFTYSDLCILDVPAIDAALPDIDASNVLTDGCGEENLSVDDAFPVINHFSVGMFNWVLRGSEDTLDMLTAAESARLIGDEGKFLSQVE